MHNTLRSILVLKAAENLCSCSLGRRRSLKRAADSRGRQQRGEIFTPKICCQMCHATMPSWPRGYGLHGRASSFSKAAPRFHDRETKLLKIPPNLPRFPNERDGACHPAHARCTHTCKALAVLKQQLGIPAAAPNAPDEVHTTSPRVVEMLSGFPGACRPARALSPHGADRKHTANQQGTTTPSRLKTTCARAGHAE